MSFLKIRDLTFTYPGSADHAIDGLDLDVDIGQVTAVIGPNAAGKSTLALLLKGLLQPASGRIWIDGVLRETPGPDSSVGLLFSNPENQLVTSIVEEDIAFGLEVLGESPRVIREKVESVLSRLGIAHLRKRMPHLMSGGEQQMAALAGLLVLDPDIIVLDEPTTYLDPDARMAVLEYMRRLAGQGKVIILITHDMKEAAAADNIVLLDRGRTLAAGSPGQVFGRPGISERSGISPPFTFQIQAGLKEMGLGDDLPADPAALAAAVISRSERAPGSAEVSEGTASSAGGGVPLLVFDRIWFSYDQDPHRGLPILRGVEFSVDRGSMALICGANGSGKSTLLQMSNGLVEPDRGQVLLGGRQLKQLRKKGDGIHAQVALLFQNPERQLFSATVFEDIAFGPRNLGLNAQKVKARVLKAAEWTGLPETVLKRHVATLSGGQMRRVAVAGSLAMEPDVLVLDEPVDGLDPGSAGEFYSRARRYCDETGTTIIVAAHAVPEEIAVFDHFGHLDDGVMKSAGPPADTLLGHQRTLPGQFLPDHLLMAGKLLGTGPYPARDLLEPAAVYRLLLELAERYVH